MVASEPGHAGPGRNVSHEPVETRAPESRGAGPGVWLARDICHLSGEGEGVVTRLKPGFFVLLPSNLRDLLQHQMLWRLEQKMQDTEVRTSSSPNSETRISVTVLL